MDQSHKTTNKWIHNRKIYNNRRIGCCRCCWCHCLLICDVPVFLQLICVRSPSPILSYQATGSVVVKNSWWQKWFSLTFWCDSWSTSIIPWPMVKINNALASFSVCRKVLSMCQEAVLSVSYCSSSACPIMIHIRVPIQRASRRRGCSLFGSAIAVIRHYFGVYSIINTLFLLWFLFTLQSFYSY